MSENGAYVPALCSDGGLVRCCQRVEMHRPCVMTQAKLGAGKVPKCTGSVVWCELSKVAVKGNRWSGIGAVFVIFFRIAALQ